MTEPFELTIVEAARDIRDRSLSPVRLMESLLFRSSQLEPRLRVWVTLDGPAALAEAERSEEALAADGPIGPLHGIPIGVKDIYYTQGVKTTACSPIYADFVPEYDSTAVARLRAAGAIIMGKTVTTEFACMDPPPTRNPWDAAHTPGGSSSGSAVGVAARTFPAALGSQTAGSVLRPASFNGVVGVKPTFGRISRYGVMPVAWSLDTMGFFTRNVADAALLLKVLAGHDPSDDASSREPVPEYEAVVSVGQGPPRIGLMGQLFHDRASPEVREHMAGVVGKLSDAGASVEEVTAPADFDAMLAAHRVVMSVEAAAVHERDFKSRADEYGPKVRTLIESGMITPAVAYVQAQRVRGRFREEMVKAAGRFDVLLSPSTIGPAPRDLSTTGDPVFQTPWTTAGLPSVTLPSGLSESGLPLGIQLASSHFTEDRLLGAAQWCEGVLDISLRPPATAA